jgi:hypothetical protein
MSDDQPTCGKGIAANGDLPLALSNTLAAVRENLAQHLTTLKEDPASKPERDAYVELVRQHDDRTARLRKLADQMTGYRNLPMANHDEQAMASPALLEAFERLVKEEDALLTLLKGRLEQHRGMLKAWTASE